MVEENARITEHSSEYPITRTEKKYISYRRKIYFYDEYENEDHEKELRQYVV